MASSLYASDRMNKRAAKPKPDYARLAAAAHNAQKVLEVYRTNRRDMIREYVGTRWSEEGAYRPVYLNLISLYMQVVGRNLVSKNPRVMLSTFDKGDRPAVHQMEQWANDRIEEMDLAGSLHRVVDDALFSVGIMKVALATPGDAMTSGWNTPAGTPFAERVSLDDFVFDTYSRDFSSATFVGHRYRIPRPAAEERFGKVAADRLTSDVPRKHNASGDERAEVMGRGQYADDREFCDHVTVWEFYLPYHRLVCTLADDDLGSPTAGDPGGDTEPLEVVEWLGPDCGPYHFLAYNLVPDNAMPKGPVMDLIDLHEAVNRSLRKLIRQADRLKEVTAVGAAAADDGQRVMTASDGDFVNCTAPDQIRPVVTGNISSELFTLMTQLKEMFSWVAGNLDIMGGLSPQSKTATQDKMLNENSARGIADMQETTVTFTASVLKSLCWYWWNHPQLRMESAYSPPGTPEVSVKRTLTPDRRRRTPYKAMRVKVDPYSLVHATPQAKAAAVNAVVQQTIAPMMGLLQQQGVVFDAHAYVKMLSEYMDLPELVDVLQVQDPALFQGPGGAGAGSQATAGAGMPANTNRTYTRENVSATTRRGNDLAAANAMSGTDSGGDPNKGPSY